MLREAPFRVVVELPGWELFWARLEATGDADAALAELRRDVAAAARAGRSLETLAREPAAAEMRRLFKTAGTDPTRYRPSSEALLRRLLKGDELPAISPLVDLNNCLSVRLVAPCCVMDAEELAPPFHFRVGRNGESYESLRGPFELAGRPLLVDELGPCDTPITGNTRVQVRPASRVVWLVAYLPASVTRAEAAERELAAMLRRAPVAVSDVAFAAGAVST